MTGDSSESRPQRKEPGLIARLFSGVLNTIFWLFLSLLLSIIIEWIGISFFWSDQGANHAKEMLTNEQRFLHPVSYTHLTLPTTHYV